MRATLSTTLAIIYILASSCSSIKDLPLIPYRKGNLWGYSDSTGRIVIKPKYELAGQFFSKRAWVKKEGLFWYIDERGKRAIRKKFAKADDFDYGLANVVSKNLKDTMRIDIHGRKGYAGLWFGDDTHTSDFFDARKIAVGDPKDFHSNKEFYGRIGDSLKIIKFEKFRGFRAGNDQPVDHAVVTVSGREGVINEDGVFILQPIYDRVQATEDLYFKVMKGVKWAYFDRAGNKVTDFEFDQLGFFWTSSFGKNTTNEFTIVRKDGKYGVIGIDGKLRTAIKFESVSFFRDGLLLTVLNGKPGYINSQGKEFFEE
jgi:hypothetical protein